MWESGSNSFNKTLPTLPLDALERAARHVHNAAGWTRDHAHQTFTDAFKETSCPLLLCPYGERGAEKERKKETKEEDKLQ